MKTNSYPFCVSYIRAIEKRLLSESDMDKLVMTNSFTDALRMLSDHGYKCDNFDTNDYENMLKNEYLSTYKEISEIAPEDSYLDLFVIQNDFHNLKVALKSLKTGYKNYKSLFLQPATIDPQLIFDCIVNGSFSELPEMLSNLAECSFNMLSKTNDSQITDTIIDKYMMDYSVKESHKTNNTFFEKYYLLVNTLLNFKIAYRCSLMKKDRSFLDGAISNYCNVNCDYLIDAALNSTDEVVAFIEKNGYEKISEALKISVSEFEKACDNTITDFIKDTKYISFGVEPIIAYLYSKQMEITCVRIVLSGKLNGVDNSTIKERLRELYV